MGVATNQIATKGDLMKCGYTEISTSVTNAECVTHGDIRDLVKNGFIGGVAETWTTITPTVNRSSSSVTVSIESYKSVEYLIATYMLPNDFKHDDYNYCELGYSSNNITISTNSTLAVDCWGSFRLHFGDDSSNYVAESETYATLSNGATFNYYLSPQSIQGIDSDVLYLSFVFENHSSSTKSFTLDFTNLSSYNLILNYIPLPKCIKYSIASSKFVRVPWYFGINEQVTGKTAISKIIVRYAYKTSSTGSETYVEASSVPMSDPDAANGTFTNSPHYVEYNPRELRSSVPYSARMTLWCGTTRNNQTWSYRIKKRNGSWTSWSSTSKATSKHVDPLVDFPELLTSNPYSSLSGGEAQWLQAIYAIRGVEFKVT